MLNRARSHPTTTEVIQNTNNDILLKIALHFHLQINILSSPNWNIYHFRQLNKTKISPSYHIYPKLEWKVETQNANCPSLFNVNILITQNFIFTWNWNLFYQKIIFLPDRCKSWCKYFSTADMTERKETNKT